MQPLVGDTVSVTAVHPRARVLNIAEQLDGRRLLSADSQGKNLLLCFEPSLVLVSHLMMRGRWRMRALSEPADEPGQPWLRITGSTHEATQWNGPVLRLGRERLRRLGPDVLAEPAPIAALVVSLRGAAQERAIADVLLDQRVVAGVGNFWRSELLFAARIDPVTPLNALSDADLRSLMELTTTSMAEGRPAPGVYRRTHRPCRLCGTTIVSRRLGEHARNVYWCPSCQGGDEQSRT